MLITICIPSIRPDTLGKAIASVKRQTHDAWELIVVGQGDEETLRDTVEAAADGDERIRYSHLDKFGCSAARNQGIREAKGEVIAFLDDDCEAAADWAKRLVAAYEQYPDVGLIGGSLVRPDLPEGSPRFAECPETIPLEVMYHPLETGNQAPHGFGVAGGNLSLRMSVAEAVGPFDELLGAGARYGAAEDTDYVLRVEALPATLRSDPAIVVNHTYGYRFGIRNSYRILRAYAVGNGALAAKLTLTGDPRGHEWLRHEMGNTFVDPIAGRRPWLLPRRLLRLLFYAAAYGSCRRRCTVTGPAFCSTVLTQR